MRDDAGKEVLWQISNEANRERNHLPTLERRERAEELHRTGRRCQCEPSGGETYDGDASSSSRIIHSWAMTHSTFRPTPYASRKSHSLSRSSVGQGEKQDGLDYLVERWCAGTEREERREGVQLC